MADLVYGYLCSNITIVDAFYVKDHIFTNLAKNPSCIPQAIPKKEFDKMIKNQHHNEKKSKKKCFNHKNKN